MSEASARDRAWVAVIDSIFSGRCRLTSKGIAEEADISPRTAKRVLKVAEEEEILVRDGDRDHTWQTNIKMVDVTNTDAEDVVRSLIDD